MRRYVVTPSGCWQWLGALDPDGYGRLRVDGRQGLVHRVYYERMVGAIAEGLEIDHLCRNRGCVNPAHLEPVTHAENMRRSAPAQKSHCVNGHPYDEENTYIRPSGQRDCRACIRTRVARYKQARLAA